MLLKLISYWQCKYHKLYSILLYLISLRANNNYSLLLNINANFEVSRCEQKQVVYCVFTKIATDEFGTEVGIFLPLRTSRLRLYPSCGQRRARDASVTERRSRSRLSLSWVYGRKAITLFAGASPTKSHGPTKSARGYGLLVTLSGSRVSCRSCVDQLAEPLATICPLINCVFRGWNVVHFF